MSQLDFLAKDIGTTAKTLRRAAANGTIRAWRPSARRIELSPGEQAYLRGHWTLLSALRRALRTEPNVKLAVMFGSLARGDDDEASDVDLLVDLVDQQMTRRLALARRLEAATGREVQLIPLSEARKDPVLLYAAVSVGRVILDREELWPRLWSRRDQLRRAADEELRVAKRRAFASVNRLLESV